jgi:Esterase-like activity of phytase
VHWIVANHRIEGAAFVSVDISDAALLPSGDLLILERSSSWPEGLLVRICRIPLAAIRPNAVVDGSVLIEADLGDEIDNMEGLSVHRTATGKIVLTLISDDNFSEHASSAIHAGRPVIHLLAQRKQIGAKNGNTSEPQLLFGAGFPMPIRAIRH